MKTVLVTGSLGLVGRACMSYFKERGWAVVGIDANMRSRFFGTEDAAYAVETTHVDIREEEEVEALFKKHSFDAIIHAAAQPSHDYATDHAIEDFDVNARGTLLLLEATRKYCPDATFVFISTDKVYGENMAGERLSDESLGLDFAGDRSLFGCSKAAADMYVQEYGTRFRMKTACFRPGCITGKNHKGAEQHGFLAYLAKCIREGKPYTIFGHGGLQVRDQIHADDLASAIYAFVQEPKIAAVYNIGGGPDREVNILQAIALIEAETGKKAITKDGPPRPGDRVYDVHDVTKFRTDYPDWDYKYSLQDIIKDLCEI